MIVVALKHLVISLYSIHKLKTEFMQDGLYE